MTATAPVHTPYDGSAKPFSIGLSPIDSRDWIEPDRHLEAYLVEKERLIADKRRDVFVEEPGTRDAQAETLVMLAGFLPERFPEIWSRQGCLIRVADTTGTGLRTVDLSDETQPPLLAAARLVQEDLVIMRKGEDGWRLAAACVCFPSSWTLTEKFSRPLQDIHAPVPGFGAGTRTSEIITRIFDNLQPDMPTERWNWSLSESNSLHNPFSETGRRTRTETGHGKFAGKNPTAAIIRVERQTLSKLPRSGDILFTIRIHLDPLAILRRHPERRQLATAFARQLTALTGEQLAYKGIAADRDRLVAALHAIAVS